MSAWGWLQQINTLPSAGLRTDPAARPHFFAQGPDQRGVLAETLNEDRACAFERGGPIAYSLIRFGVPASHLLRALLGPRDKRLRQRLKARFAGDLSFRPTLRPKGQIEILEPRLAVSASSIARLSAASSLSC
jgi:hypothetical protein